MLQMSSLSNPKRIDSHIRRINAISHEHTHIILDKNLFTARKNRIKVPQKPDIQDKKKYKHTL